MFLPGTGRGTIRRMVEGVLRLRKNAFEHAFNVLHDIDCPNTKHPVAVQCEKLVANGVTLRPVSEAVHFAINFNHQAPFAYVEINDIGADRMLSTNLHPQPRRS